MKLYHGTRVPFVHVCYTTRGILWYAPVVHVYVVEYQYGLHCVLGVDEVLASTRIAVASSTGAATKGREGGRRGDSSALDGDC